MPHALPFLSLTLILAALGLFAAAGHAATYRWVDDNGVVHYTDTLPPDQIRKGHTEISETGIHVRTIPPAKTPEQLQQDQEMERLRAEQERLLERERKADRLLLRAFRSEDDIIMARDGKLATIDVMIQVTRNNIRRQQEWLAGLWAEAAELERAGKATPQHLRDSIAKTERSIGGAYETIVQREQQKEFIRDSFDKDLARYRKLNDLPEAEAQLDPDAARPLLHNLVTCADSEECVRLWQRASSYVREQATTALQTEGERILITAPPRNDQDISLILSRIDDETGSGALLFLDLQCRRSIRGNETCQSAAARGIIEGFRGAVVGASAPAP